MRSNIALEPAAPMTLYAPRLSAKRYTDREEEPRIIFHLGRCGFLVFIAAPGCFGRQGQVEPRGAFGRFDRRRGHQEKEQPAAATIGVLRGMSPSGGEAVGHARPAARRGVAATLADGWSTHRSTNEPS